MNDNRQAQILGSILWAQCIFVGSTFRTLPLTTGLAAISTTVVLLIHYLKNPSAVRDRSINPAVLKTIATVGFLVTAGLVAPWRAANRLSEEINYVYLAIDTLAHTAMIFSWILWMIRPAKGHASMIPLGCIITLMACAAGGASSSLTAQSAIALTICIGFVIGSEIILRHQHGFGAAAPGTRQSLPASKWLAPIFSLLVLSLLLMGTSGIANGTNMILPSIQNILQEELNTSFNAMAEESFVGGTRYVRGSKLGSLRKHMLGDPAEVAVQAYCEITPGYLRGSVFDQYFRGRWIDSGSFEYQRYTRTQRIPDRLIASDSAGSEELNVTSSKSLNRFELVPNPPDKIITIEVLSDPSKGSIIFTPLNTFWIEARARELSYSHHGIIRSGIDVRRPYVAGVGQQLPPTTINDKIKIFTRLVPPTLEEDLRRYGKEVVGQADSPYEIAEALSNHFQSEYGYSLTTEIKRPKREDPIIHFLDQKHDAHCEYFASATVLILRTLGIRARYVTGYIVDELSEDDTELWVGRNRDAHAWAEAYDEERQIWFPVESTPGLTYRTIEPEKADLLAANASGFQLDDISNGNETLFERFISWFASIRVSEPIVILFRISQLPLFVVLVLYLWQRHKGSVSSLDAREELRCRRMLRTVDRIVSRMDFIRDPSETLCQFADRIHSAACEQAIGSSRKQTLTHCADWYRTYATNRYQGQTPQPLKI